MGRRQASAAAIYRLLFLLPSLFSHPTQSRQQKPVFHLKTGQSWHIIGKATTEQIEDERHTHIMNGNGAAADDLLEPFTDQHNYALAFNGLGKYSRSLPYIGVKARKMPCCTETIGTHTCNELRNKRPLAFRQRCKVDADFAILQCCQTCRTNVAQLGSELFAHGLKSRHCFDRHNRNYCSHFIHQSGMWAANAGKLVNCNGESASLAFRVCRRSCGFCEPTLYKLKPARNCTKGSGVNPTIKDPKAGTEVDVKTGEKAKGGKKEKTDQGKGAEKSKEKDKASKGKSSQASPAPTSSTKQTTTIIATTASKPSPPSVSSSSSQLPPSRPSSSPPPTLRPTFLPPTTPKLAPCSSPPPLPSLPSIPCSPQPPPQPLPTLAPLTAATISIQVQTPRPFRPVLPPIRPPLPPPILPLGPPPSPLPILPEPRPTPKWKPTPKRPVKPSPPAPKITIEWKPVPPASSSGVEVGPWPPEWPWPLPDKVIEAILNQLSGVDDKTNSAGCFECIFDAHEKITTTNMEDEMRRGAANGRSAADTDLDQPFRWFIGSNVRESPENEGQEIWN